MHSLWTKRLLGSENKIVNTLYKYIGTRSFCENINNRLIGCIQNILNMCGLPHMWNLQGSFKFIRHRRRKAILKDHSIQMWITKMFYSSMRILYRTLLLWKISESANQIWKSIFIKFRATNHHLPKETERWSGIPFSSRLCTFCFTSQIAGTFHFILVFCWKHKKKKKNLGEKHCIQILWTNEIYVDHNRTG